MSDTFLKRPAVLAAPRTLTDWFDFFVADAPILDLEGAERGFNERADVIQAADGTDLNEFWNEVNQTITIRNQKRNALMAALTTRVTAAITSVNVPSAVDFEEASEYGQPVGIRGAFTKMWRGYDWKWYDLAIRYTWMFIAEADSAQLQMNHNLALDADNKLMFNKVMKTLFNPLNVTGVGDKNEPTTVYKFYNADGEVPPVYGTFTHLGTHNHYITSGGATVTSANLATMATHLSHHGYSFANGYQLVLWVNTQELTTIKALRTATGAEYDFVANPATYEGKIWVPDNGRYVGGPQNRLPNEAGTYGPWHVVEEPYIPAGYMVGLASGGPENLQNPIGLREHANPAYQGLKIIPGQRSDYPLLDSFYRRGFGTGIRQRGAGIVMQVTASGSYTVPAIYA